MKGDEIFELLAKYFKGESSNNENEEINKWREENTENRIEFDQLKELWGSVQHENKQLDVDNAWNKVEARINSKEKYSINRSNKNFSYKILKIAASILIIIGASYFGISQLLMSNFENYEANDVKEVVAERGEIRTIKLEDGTVVTLNSGSKLQFLGNLDSDKRVVNLKGEAFFEVTSIKDRPFWVNSSNSTIKVIGTKFNVTAWDDNEVIVVVSEGKILFSSKDSSPSNSVVVANGEMSKITSDRILLKPVKVEVEEYYLSWLNNELRFNNTSFKHVIHRLELYYDIDINVSDLSILSKHLTAKFKNEPLDEVLNTIALALDLKYSKENNKKIIFGYKANGKQ